MNRILLLLLVSLKMTPAFKWRQDIICITRGYYLKFDNIISYRKNRYRNIVEKKLFRIFLRRLNFRKKTSRWLFLGGFPPALSFARAKGHQVSLFRSARLNGRARTRYWPRELYSSIVLFLVQYVLAFLATTALPHRPLHLAKPTTTTNTTNITVTTANSISASTAPVKRSPVKYSVHMTVHHPPTSGAAAAARPERGVKENLGQRCRGANDGAQAKLARGHPVAAAAAAGDDPSSKSSLDTRSASNRAATTAVQASK